MGRNDWVFDGVERYIMGKMRKAQSIIEEYKKPVELGRSNKGTSAQSPTKWVAPSGTTLKLNFDAAFSEGGKVGLGAVLRDSTWEVLMAMCDFMKGSHYVHVGEALAASQGIKIAKEARFHCFMLETDNSMVYDAVNRRKKEVSGFGLILSDILYFSICL